jgi:dynein heavy chain
MISDAGKNSETMERMEQLFAVWCGQIEQVLTEHEQIRREADNIGPSIELQFWKNRMDKFHM